MSSSETIVWNIVQGGIGQVHHPKIISEIKIVVIRNTKQIKYDIGLVQ